MTYQVFIEKNSLIDDYINKKKSILQIAKEYGYNRNTISKKLDFYGIKKRDKRENQNPNAMWDLIKSKEYLKNEYIIKKKSSTEIANFCKCSEPVILEQLKKFNIQIREHRETVNPNAKWNFLNNKEWLNKKYTEEKQSIFDIAKLCNCSGSCIHTQLKRFNIKRRAKNVCKNPNARWDLLDNKNFLENKYLFEKLSSKDIAILCNCSESFVLQKIKNFYINTRSISDALLISNKNKKENHYNWQGGISFEPYCNKFNKELKEEIRENFDRKCLICSKKENGKKLSVHHIDYNKMQGCGHKWSLIPLCESCHAKTNFNRHYWFNLLNNYWLFNNEINFINMIFFEAKQ